MTKFEQWFSAQDFYTNMRVIHGDRLFDKDGDVYRVLPVQMTWVAWGERPDRDYVCDCGFLDSVDDREECMCAQELQFNVNQEIADIAKVANFSGMQYLIDEIKDRALKGGVNLDLALRGGQ